MARSRRNAQPLDRNALEQLALRYVARYATTRAKLEAYLARKLRERGWEGEGEPPVDVLAKDMVEAGYVDDAAYARAKSNSLLRRGYGGRRVGQALAAAGIGEGLREQDAPSEAEQRQAAIVLARKRGFGPFGDAALDRARREKQIAAMLRAGHRMDHALKVIDGADVDSVQAWADEEGTE